MVSGAALAIIPTRMGSTRFPGKPLAPLRGVPVIRHVWEAVRRARTLARVAIATDAPEIAACARDFGAEAVMTSPAHETGSDRVAEAARILGGSYEAIVNVQGDEPLVAPEAVDAAVRALLESPEAAVATLAHWDDDPIARDSRQVVKVLLGDSGAARDFVRDLPPPAAARFLRHVGLYAFRPEVLAAFAARPPSLRERAEGLEQLRLLEAGIIIRVVVTAYRSRAVDTPEDLAALERDWQTLAATAGGPTSGTGDVPA